MNSIKYEGQIPNTLRHYCDRHRHQIYEACGKGILQDDAYDVGLRAGWRKNDDCVHSIIGTTVADTIQQLRSVVACDCDDCTVSSKERGHDC